MKRHFYGEGKTGPYFEGWYFKCQAQNGHSLALIPALHIREDGQRSASIQIITEDNAFWLEYPAAAFSARPRPLCIQIGKNTFSERGIQLDIEKKEISLHGRITFGSIYSLKSDIMGPFRWLSNMECSHSVISMVHSLQGKIELNGASLDFGYGMGYIESDRGRSFPTGYLWTQCMWHVQFDVIHCHDSIG